MLSWVWWCCFAPPWGLRLEFVALCVSGAGICSFMGVLGAGICSFMSSGRGEDVKWGTGGGCGFTSTRTCRVRIYN